MLDAPLNQPAAAELAARLRVIADSLDEQSRSLDLRVDSLHYEGPAARRFRLTMSERRERAQRVARTLHDVADHVQFSAQNA